MFELVTEPEHLSVVEGDCAACILIVYSACIHHVLTSQG